MNNLIISRESLFEPKKKQEHIKVNFKKLDSAGQDSIIELFASIVSQELLQSKLSVD